MMAGKLVLLHPQHWLPHFRDAMPRFERGAVLVCGRRFSVVWHDAGDTLTVLPIKRGQPRAHDVVLDDTLALGFAMAGARLRAERVTVGRTGQEQVGTVPALLVCKISLAVARHFAATADEAKWTLGAAHRERALAENLPATR